MRRKLFIITAILVLAGAGLLAPMGAQARAPLQGELTSVNIAASSFTIAGPRGPQAFVATGSTVFYSGGRKLIAFSALPEFVGSTATIWFDTVGKRYVAGRVDLAWSPIQGTFQSTEKQGVSDGASASGGSTGAGDPPGGGNGGGGKGGNGGGNGDDGGGNGGGGKGGNGGGNGDDGGGNGGGGKGGNGGGNGDDDGHGHGGHGNNEANQGNGNHDNGGGNGGSNGVGNGEGRQRR